MLSLHPFLRTPSTSEANFLSSAPQKRFLVVSGSTTHVLCDKSSGGRARLLSSISPDALILIVEDLATSLHGHIACGACDEHHDSATC